MNEEIKRKEISTFLQLQKVINFMASKHQLSEDGTELV